MKVLTHERNAKLAGWKLRHHQELLRRGRVYSGLCAHHVEEAVQQTWLKAVLYAETLEQLREEKVLPYLTQVLVNHLRELANGWRREAAADGAVHELPAPAPDPGALPDVSDEQWAWAIRALPPRVREAFLLKRQGFKHREIAQRMGIAVGTVGALLHDAYERLRRELRR